MKWHSSLALGKSTIAQLLLNFNEWTKWRSTGGTRDRIGNDGCCCDSGREPQAPCYSSPSTSSTQCESTSRKTDPPPHLQTARRDQATPKYSHYIQERRYGSKLPVWTWPSLRTAQCQTYTPHDRPSFSARPPKAFLALLYLDTLHIDRWMSGSSINAALSIADAAWEVSCRSVVEEYVSWRYQSAIGGTWVVEERRGRWTLEWT